MIVWGLLILGLLFLVAEAWLPSGGLLLLLALGCLGVGLIEAFRVSPRLGWTILALDLVLTPATIGVGLYLWQRSPMAAKMTLTRPGHDEHEMAAERDALRHLVGTLGRTLTPLRPTGYVAFEGLRLEGHAEEGWIAEDTDVLAVATRGSRVVVRRSSTASDDTPVDPGRTG